MNSGCCCWVAGVCASRGAKEAERTRKIRGITAMVAFMGGIISQDCRPDDSDPRWSQEYSALGMSLGDGPPPGLATGHACPNSESSHLSLPRRAQNPPQADASKNHVGVSPLFSSFQLFQFSGKPPRR